MRKKRKEEGKEGDIVKVEKLWTGGKGGKERRDCEREWRVGVMVNRFHVLSVFRTKGDELRGKVDEKD